MTDHLCLWKINDDLFDEDDDIEVELEDQDNNGPGRGEVGETPDGYDKILAEVVTQVGMPERRKFGG
jgi:hypothetical protein